jgi:23S rRNA (uracil1939-C5)-methyltransferase
VDDEARLKAFAERHQVQIWLQPKGPETVAPFWPLDAPGLAYTLPEFNVEMPFRPTDFTQVNHQINATLVSRALRLLDAKEDERIGDFFCGLGNFTLPIARSAREVVGVEGSATLVARSRENAAHNGLAQKTEFHAANLFEATPESIGVLGHFDKALIDPPREGAMELVKALGSRGELAPRRIVYVSCNPSTLARDAGALVGEFGYTLKSAGVVNMFPHTSHVESIALFDR